VIAVVEVDAVLCVDRGGLGRAVLAEALRLAYREGCERFFVGLFRCGDAHQPCLAERAVGRLELVASLGNAEVEEGAPHDGRVALTRIVGTLEHADAADDLGDDEVDVGVALSVNMERDVDGDFAHFHLDARAVVEVEAAKVDVVAQALAILVVDEEARRGREHLARLLARRGGQGLAVDADIAEATRRGPGNRPDLHRLHACLDGRRRVGSRGFGWARGRCRHGGWARGRCPRWTCGRSRGWTRGRCPRWTWGRSRGWTRGRSRGWTWGRCPFCRGRFEYDDVLDARADRATVSR